MLLVLVLLLLLLVLLLVMVTQLVVVPSLKARAFSAGVEPRLLRRLLVPATTGDRILMLAVAAGGARLRVTSS